MPRASNAVASKKRRKKIMKAAKGYWGGKSRLYRTAKESVERARLYAYRDRRNRKREFRKLWISRINAAVRPFGLNYAQFIHLLTQKKIELNRKVLADIAITDPGTFEKIVERIR
jgi:large subunit ribosomal protein L20